jgi:uncharacterized protein YabN with tetrapyrrole methylase and pyrophosphatase domain
VFDGLAVDGISQVLSNWEELKRREKGDRALASSLFEGIPHSMPALARAQAMLRRAARWRVTLVEDEVLEQISRTVATLSASSGQEALKRRLGDLLFDVARLGSAAGVDLEAALREASGRFEEQLQRAVAAHPRRD